MSAIVWVRERYRPIPKRACWDPAVGACSLGVAAVLFLFLSVSFCLGDGDDARGEVCNDAGCSRRAP